MDFGQKLNHLRKSRGWTMQYLADLLNDENSTKIGKGRISQWEHGVNDPAFSTVIQMADIFGISVNYFMPGAEDDTNKYLLDNQFELIKNDYLSLVPRRRTMVDDFIKEQLHQQNNQ